MLLDRKEVQDKINVAIRGIVDSLPEHYIYPNIKDIFCYCDSSVNIEGFDKLKIELYFDFKEKCSKDDVQFFMTRISTNLSNVRNFLFDNDNIFITHVISVLDSGYSKEQLDRVMITTDFKKIIRSDKLNSLLDE